MAGNINHYKTPAEVSSSLRRRPFFWSAPDFGGKFAKFETNFGEDLFVIFLVFTRIAASLRLHLDSTAKASTQATFYSFNAACIRHQTKSDSNFSFLMCASCLYVNHFLFYFSLFLLAVCTAKPHFAVPLQPPLAQSQNRQVAATPLMCTLIR